MALSTIKKFLTKTNSSDTKQLIVINGNGAEELEQYVLTTIVWMLSSLNYGVILYSASLSVLSNGQNNLWNLMWLLNYTVVPWIQALLCSWEC